MNIFLRDALELCVLVGMHRFSQELPFLLGGARRYNSTCFFEFLRSQVHWIMCLPQDFSEGNALSLMQIPSPHPFKAQELSWTVGERGCSIRTGSNYSNIKNRVLKKFETSTLLAFKKQV